MLQQNWEFRIYILLLNLILACINYCVHLLTGCKEDDLDGNMQEPLPKHRGLKHSLNYGEKIIFRSGSYRHLFDSVDIRTYIQW